MKSVRQLTEAIVFGNEKFQQEMALAIGRRTWHGTSGIPPIIRIRSGKISILIVKIASK